MLQKINKRDRWLDWNSAMLSALRPLLVHVSLKLRHNSRLRTCTEPFERSLGDRLGRPTLEFV